MSFKLWKSMTLGRMARPAEFNGNMKSIEDAINALLDGCVPVTRLVSAGNGLTGGGSLSADRSITLGTPSTCTASSANAVTSESHTHAISGFVPVTKATSDSSGAGGDVLWIRVARITFPNRYAYIATKIEIMGRPSTGGLAYGCSLYFSALQQSAMPSNPVGSLRLSNTIEISTANIEAIIVKADSEESIIEIYVQSVHNYKMITAFALEDAGSASISHALGTWQAALPSGTAMYKTQID